jgi:hypothetical protein
VVFVVIENLSVIIEGFQVHFIVLETNVVLLPFKVNFGVINRHFKPLFSEIENSFNSFSVVPFS